MIDWSSVSNDEFADFYKELARTVFPSQDEKTIRVRLPARLMKEIRIRKRGMQMNVPEFIEYMLRCLYPSSNVSVNDKSTKIPR